MIVKPSTGMKLIALKDRIATDFTAENWEELGLLIGATDIIVGHPRLLRSLGWNDQDYSGNVLTVLRQIIEENPRALKIIEAYMDKHYPDESTYISAKPSERKITFAPHVFHVPEEAPDTKLGAVMMPFAMEFDDVYKTIKEAVASCRLQCLRADDIWEESSIIQDVFNLIYRAQIVIVDFTGKNPNVMYETGIAHTLGKSVIPITQNLGDIPFDMGHHRALKYLANGEGLVKLGSRLESKLRQICKTLDIDM